MALPVPARVHPGADLQIDDFYVHIPPGATEPLTAVVVLHGMGSGGESFSRSIRGRTDEKRWVIVAPTFNYGNWRDPVQLTREATENSPQIASFLDRLPEVTGMTVRPRVFMYGFSRGGQAAHRFALALPERVGGVAMISPGTYTLPLDSFGSDDGLPFPYGVENFRQLFGREFNARAFARIPFWIGVGGSDSNPTDVPRQWDPYLGDDRVERAERFTAYLRQGGSSAQLRVFPGVGHEETDEMRAAAMDFLASLD